MAKQDAERIVAAVEAFIDAKLKATPPPGKIIPPGREQESADRLAAARRELEKVIAAAGD